MVELVLRLAITVLAAQNAQSIVILEAAGQCDHSCVRSRLSDRRLGRHGIDLPDRSGQRD